MADVIKALQQPDVLMLAGDWHGYGDWAQKAIHHARKNGAKTILQLGDFGIWPGREGYKYLRFVDKTLEECDIDLLVVPGNHEDYEQLGIDHPGREPFTLRVESRTTFLPRGYRWEWWGQTWMALGGAFSVDDFKRVEGKSWWPGETLTDEQVEYAARPGDVDVIVAHDCPSGVDIPGIGPNSKGGDWPIRSLNLSEQHRQKIRRVVDTVKPGLYFHGHYHCRYTSGTYLPGGDVMKVVGLDMDHTTLADNTYFLGQAKEAAA